MIATLLIAALLGLDVAMMSGCDDKSSSPPPPPTPAPSPNAPQNPSTPPTPMPSSTSPTPAPNAPTPAAPESTPRHVYKTADVTIAKTKLKLDIASDNDTRMLGLGGRTEIPEQGGMIFVFPPSQVGVQNFVMRDCPIDIDIIYTDGVGRVLAFHEMKADPRKPDEGVPGLMDPSKMTEAQWKAYQKYESRLKKYSSRYPATFAIELRAGSIKKLGVREGDLVTMDHSGLKKMAR